MGHERVSILLLLELRPKLFQRAEMGLACRCFNPSSTGIAAQTIFRAKAAEDSKGFNPSSTGIAAQTMRRRLLPGCRMKVSILLLLELRPKQLRCSSPCRRLPRFNPSSTGIAAQTLIYCKPFGFVKLFQSFFYWNCGPNIGTCKRRFPLHCVSILLLLELRPKPCTFAAWKNDYQSFNPSSTGIAAQTQAYKVV